MKVRVLDSPYEKILEKGMKRRKISYRAQDPIRDNPRYGMGCGDRNQHIQGHLAFHYIARFSFTYILTRVKTGRCRFIRHFSFFHSIRRAHRIQAPRRPVAAGRPPPPGPQQFYR